jgi:polyvinyl alcohol dehydrogenase (cytochrome)
MLLRNLSLALVSVLAARAAAPDGEALYKQRCATCHDGKPQPRMPSHDELAGRTPESIYRAMFEGAMAPESAGLSADEGRAIARFLTGKEFGATAGATTGKCAAAPGPLRMSDADWNGWGNDLGNSRYQPKPGLTAADVPNLKLKWAFAFAGDTVRAAQPTVVGNRVFAGGSNGSVYSLDAATGCTYWKYDAGAMVRNAISIGQAGGKSIAYFGDVRATVHALDLATGQLVWKMKVEDHPAARITGSPVFYGGRVYVPVSSIEEASAMLPTYACCKFRGSIVALDGATGKQIWKSFSVVDPPTALADKNSAGAPLWGPAGAAIWSAPTIDVAKKVLYAATGNSYTNVSIPTANAILAFDLETGSLLWSSQVLPKDNFTMACSGRGANCPPEPGPDYDFGTSPILRDLPGGKRILVCGQKSGIVWGLDPDQRGKVIWQTRVGQGSALGGIEWGHTADLDNTYVAVSDLLVRGENRPGGLHALKLTTGEKVWSTPPPELHCTAGTKGCNSAQSAAISSIPGVVFSGSIDGHFRAFLTRTGEIVWDFNTARDFETVNGVAGKGGSLDSAGPVISGGMVFTNSGYGMWQGLPGNVLLAFGK